MREKVPIHVEIWICASLLSREKEVFVKKELNTYIYREFSDSRHGISTHISSVCVANKRSNHPKNYNYLISLGRGEYRTFKEGDPIHPSKINSRNRPDPEDIPDQYKYLLDKQSGSQELRVGDLNLIQDEGVFHRGSREDAMRASIDFKALKESENEAIARTILMMAYNPSCGRIFSKQANNEIKNLICGILFCLPNITAQAEFNKVHKDVLDKIVQDIKNLRKDGKSRDITYGQAQKGLNVFLKVYVDWANLPSPEIASILRPFLHCPLDSVVMREIKKKELQLYHKYRNPPCTLRSLITYDQYLNWQSIIGEIIQREGYSKRTIIDVIWYLESLKKRIK